MSCIFPEEEAPRPRSIAIISDAVCVFEPPCPPSTPFGVPPYGVAFQLRVTTAGDPTANDKPSQPALFPGSTRITASLDKLYLPALWNIDYYSIYGAMVNKHANGYKGGVSHTKID